MEEIKVIKNEYLLDIEQLYNKAFEIDIKIYGTEEEISFRNKNQVEVFKKMSADDNVVMLGYFIDNKIVGFLTLNIHDFFLEYTNPFASIWSVCVDPDYRRRGIGRKLMIYAERLAKNEYNCESIYLYSGRSRRAAHALYESLGYDSERKAFKKELK